MLCSFHGTIWIKFPPPPLPTPHLFWWLLFSFVFVTMSQYRVRFVIIIIDRFYVWSLVLLNKVFCWWRQQIWPTLVANGRYVLGDCMGFERSSHYFWAEQQTEVGMGQGNQGHAWRQYWHWTAKLPLPPGYSGLQLPPGYSGLQLPPGYSGLQLQL